MSRLRPAIRRFALLVLAAGLLQVAAPQRAAAFGDCGGAGYFANVDLRYRGAGGVDCVEAESFSIRTPDGPVEVRIVHEADYPGSDIGIVVAEIRRGIERSEAGLLSIGQGTSDPITVFASRLLPPPDATEDEEAEGAAVVGDDGCRMIVYPGVSGRADLAYLVAHEFFHCVQFATQGRAQVMSGRNVWWIEGSAEWFAVLAFPGSTNSRGHVAGFDETSSETPLTSMAYESVVFFFWLSQSFGASMTMALMDAMPERGSAAEQQAAILGLLSEDDLLRFAQAYLDREIRRPGGGAIGSNPFPGDIYVYDRSDEHEIEAEAFVLARAQLEFSCGHWTIRRNEELGRWRVKKPGEDWNELPEHLEVAGPAPDLYRLAAFGPQPAGFRLKLEAERDACRGCDGVAAADEASRACLVGGWELVSGGYGEVIERMLRAQGILETVEYPEFFVELTIAADGSYETAGTTPHKLTVRNDEGELHTLQGDFTYETSGTWSVDGEELLMCEVSVHAAIDDEMIDPDGDVEVVRAEGGPDSGPLLRHRDFTCDGGSLVLVEDLPMAPTVTWVYGRR